MKRNHLLEMRQSGWFDFMLLLLLMGITLLVLGTIGLLQYNEIQQQLGPNATIFELKQAHNFLSKGHAAFLYIGGLSVATSLLGLLSLRFLAPIVRADVRKQKFLKHFRIVLQYTVAITLTMLMLFPIYWMIVSSLKTSDELLLARANAVAPRDHVGELSPGIKPRAVRALPIQYTGHHFPHDDWRSRDRHTDGIRVFQG